MIKKAIFILLFPSLGFACGGAFNSSVTINNAQTVQGAWHMDVESGTGSWIVDSSTNIYSLTYTGSGGTNPTIVNGYIGKGYQFAGSNTTIVRTSNEFTGWGWPAWTIEGWVKINNMIGNAGCNSHSGYSTCGTFFSIGDSGGSKFGINFGQIPNGNLYVDTAFGGGWKDVLQTTMTVGSLNVSSQTHALYEGMWYFVTLTGNQGDNTNANKNLTFYVNGTSVSRHENMLYSALGDNSGPMSINIGKLRVAAGEYSGVMDEWTLRNSSSTASDVKARYSNYVAMHDDACE